MAAKWKNTKIAENVGLLHVHRVVNECMGILNKIDGSNDIGLDAYLEFVENETATGLCIGMQIKSGNSYQNDSATHAILKGDKSHFDYWYRHTLPIAGIVYIPEDNQAYWIDITEYLQNNQSSINAGPFNIQIEKTSIFNKNTYISFFNKFSSYKESFNKEWNLARALKGIVDFKAKNERIDSIKSLFYYHRDCKESWYYIIQLFKTENDEDIQSLLIYTLRHITSHGDIYWHKNNMVPNEVESYARQTIRTYFKQGEILKLLKHIDENGFCRGSIGQDIYAILRLIPFNFDFFKNFILNKETSEEIRFWAAIIVIDEFQHYDIQRAIYFCDSMIENFPDSENKERFQTIKELLIKYEFVDIH